ncbi:MAG: hypothetical protein K0U64_03150 [Actinomycetia bacterium]|nr:hypothetical protein [Actinomycetes bacterium]
MAGKNCPQCGGPLQIPDLMSSAYRCPIHGDVAPVETAVLLDQDHLPGMIRSAQVPIWFAWPLPVAWVSAGIQRVGDSRSGAVAAVTALAGQSLTDGPSDLLIVSEQPGIGFGARLAGLPYFDPGEEIADTPCDTKVHAGRWITPLWSLASPDRVVYVGESGGNWLWLIGWPAAVWSVIHDDLHLIDLRSAGPEVDIPAGALTPRL